MSKSFTGERSLAELTEGHAADSALDIHREAEITSESERSELLKLANSLVDERPTKPTLFERNSNSIVKKRLRKKKRSPSRVTSPAKARASAAAIKQRFGLPEGFVPRLQRYGRSVLLEENIYRLP